MDNNVKRVKRARTQIEQERMRILNNKDNNGSVKDMFEWKNSQNFSVEVINQDTIKMRK